MMNLKILLPTGVFAEVSNVSRMVVETSGGSCGLWPQRLDCVAGLVPGILCYQSGQTVVFVAVDRGVLVKSGADVRVSVRRAVAGSDLSALHSAVKEEFLHISQSDRETRQAAAKLEAGLIVSMQALHRA